MTTSVPTEIAADLAREVRELLRPIVASAGDLTVSIPTRVFGGNARQAWKCDASWMQDGVSHDHPLILLVRAAGSQVQTDPAREFSALHGLAEQGVRAPKIWAQDPDGHRFGGPAVLLERLPGRADPVEFLSADPELGRARSLDLARAAAELHAAEPPQLGAEEPQLAYWRSRFESSRLEPYPVLSALFDWLENHEVAPSRRALVHGDFRVGNVLYDGEHIVGLLDWEMAHLGDPIEDLAWAYRALWSPQRFVSLDEFVLAYETAGGAAVTEDALRWQRIFCEVKFATISLQAARAFADGQSHNLRLIDRARTVVPCVQDCLRWIAERERDAAPC